MTLTRAYAGRPTRQRVGLTRAHATDEFALTTVLLFLVVTVGRWLRDPGSILYIPDLGVAFTVIGVLSGSIVTGRPVANRRVPRSPSGALRGGPTCGFGGGHGSRAPAMGTRGVSSTG